ncbi:MAG TPA: FKBP-type peptidyl-prolyl cis-trans isomerase [Brumimicrobium sp.]|nr:FKBP-type peptidyl-prolyl cis-trans isomerase [Brumimicrobium sp.]
MIQKLFPFICLLLLLTACEEEQKEKPFIPDWTQKQSTTLNERLTREEDIKIRVYLKQRENWDIKETGSGLRFWIYEDNEGVLAQENDKVDVKFEVRLLNDSLLYKSEEGEVSSFKVDKSDIETGVMEGIKYLSEGDKAKFIIPSHLGHGLLGDFRKIPPLEVLVIDLELIKIY